MYHAEEYQVRVSGVILLVSGVIVGVSVRRQKCVTLKSPESSARSHSVLGRCASLCVRSWSLQDQSWSSSRLNKDNLCSRKWDMTQVFFYCEESVIEESVICKECVCAHVFVCDRESENVCECVCE